MDIVTLGVIGGAVWSLLILLAVGVCRAAARADDAAAADYAELLPSAPTVAADTAAGTESRRPVKPAPRLVLR